MTVFCIKQLGGRHRMETICFFGWGPMTWTQSDGLVLSPTAKTWDFLLRRDTSCLFGCDLQGNVRICTVLSVAFQRFTIFKTKGHTTTFQQTTNNLCSVFCSSQDQRICLKWSPWTNNFSTKIFGPAPP